MAPNQETSRPAIVDAATRLRIWLTVALVATTSIVVASLGGDPAQAAVSWTRVAGTDLPSSNDGSPATDGPIDDHPDFAVDADGNIYFVSSFQYRIRRIDGTTGLLSTVAGTGEFAPNPVDGVGVEVPLGFLGALAMDGAGNVYFVESSWAAPPVIRRLDVGTGMLSTVAGSSGLSAADLVVLSDGTIVVGGDNYVKALKNGVVTTLAGTGTCCGDPAGNGGPAVNAATNPSRLAVGPDETIYIVEGWSGYGGPLRAIDPITDEIDVVAVDGSVPDTVSDAAVSSTGAIYLSFGGEVRELAPGGTTTLLVGEGAAGGGADDLGVQVSSPRLALDPSDNLYSWDSRLLRIAPPTVEVVGGQHAASLDGELAVATWAAWVSADESDTDLVVATAGEIARVSAGVLDVIAGTTVSGYTGDGGVGTDARVNVTDLAVAGDGSVYFADSLNHVVRKIDGTTGDISTIAGTGTAGSAMNELDSPTGLAVDASGTVYVADQGNHRVQAISSGGAVSTFAGTGVAGFSGDGGAPGAAQLSSPMDVSVDGAAVYIADTGNHRVRRVDAGTISTVAGDGTNSFTFSGVDPLTTSFPSPSTISVDDGDLVVRTVWDTVRVTGGVTSTLSGWYSARVDDTTRGNALMVQPGTISRLEADGSSTPLVGSETSGFNDLDGLVATETFVPNVISYAVSSDGSLFLMHSTAGINRLVPGPGATFERISSDWSSGSIVGAVDPSTALVNDGNGFSARDLAGTTRIYGNGSCGSAGDGGPASAAEMCPGPVAVDAAGNITFGNWISNWPDPSTITVRRIDATTGIISSLTAPVTAQNNRGYTVSNAGVLYSYPATGGGGTATISVRQTNGTTTNLQIPYDLVYDLEVAPNGHMYLAAAKNGATLGSSSWDIVRLKPDGSFSSTPGYAEANIEVGPSGEVYVAHNVLRSQFGGNGTVIDRLDGLVVTTTTTTSTTTTTTTTTTQPAKPTGSLTIDCAAGTVKGSVTTTTANSTVTLTINGEGNGVIKATPGTSAISGSFEPGPVAAKLLVGTTQVASKQADCTAEPAPAFETMKPARILETRSGAKNLTVDHLFEGIGRLDPGSTLELQVAGRGGVPDDAVAAMLNVTAIFPDAFGFVTVYPCGEPRPNASNVNYGPSEVVPNAVLAKIGVDGKVCIYSFASTHMVVDVNGYVPAGGTVGTVVPARLLETRKGPDLETIDHLFEGEGPIEAGETLELKVAGRGKVPTDAKAAVINVTAIKPTSNGFATVYPCGVERPEASNLNFRPGQIVPNAVLATIGDGGKVCIYSSAKVGMAVDVNGYIPSVSATGAIAPARLVDSRIADTAVTVDGLLQGIGRIPADSVLEVPVAGRGGVPSDAASVFLNVTAFKPSTDGFATVYPCGEDVPNASNLNFTAGQVVPNAVLAKIGTGGKVCVYTFSELDLLLDVNGYSR